MVIDALCVAALCCASLSLPPVSTINVTRYPRADNENIRGPTSPCLLPIFLSLSQEEKNYEIIRVGMRIERGATKIIQKWGGVLLRVTDYRKTI